MNSSDDELFNDAMGDFVAKDRVVEVEIVDTVGCIVIYIWSVLEFGDGSEDHLFDEFHDLVAVVPGKEGVKSGVLLRAEWVTEHCLNGLVVEAMEVLDDLVDVSLCAELVEVRHVGDECLLRIGDRLDLADVFEDLGVREEGLLEKPAGICCADVFVDAEALGSNVVILIVQIIEALLDGSIESIDVGVVFAGVRVLRRVPIHEPFFIGLALIRLAFLAVPGRGENWDGKIREGHGWLGKHKGEIMAGIADTLSGHGSQRVAIHNVRTGAKIKSLCGSSIQSRDEGIIAEEEVIEDGAVIPDFSGSHERRVPGKAGTWNVIA